MSDWCLDASFVVNLAVADFDIGGLALIIGAIALDENCSRVAAGIAAGLADIIVLHPSFDYLRS